MLNLWAFLVQQTALLEPQASGILIRADKENLLHGAGGVVEALESGVRGILELQAARVSFAHLDASGHDATDLRAALEHPITDLIETKQASVLTLHLSELHLPRYTLRRTARRPRLETGRARVEAYERSYSGKRHS